MKFPQDLLRFLYWIFFKPFSLRAEIQRLDPGIGNAATLFTRPLRPAALPLRNLALFYIVLVPLLLGYGTALLLSRQGLPVNWLNLTLYLVLIILMTTSFSIGFCIAFLLPFSVVLAMWSSSAFTPTLGLLFSLMLGLAYGLSTNNVRWGLIAGLVYGLVIGLLTGLLGGLVVGAAFLLGYFRIIFYVIEAPLSWILGTHAMRGDALEFWRFQPVRWDELIWFPLPRLDWHLQALKEQNRPDAQAAIRQVRESFRQKWAVERTRGQRKLKGEKE